MADIFLSYAREDVTTAQQIAGALESLGWSVFWDWRIPHGEDFRAFIGRQLDEAPCVVVLWSEVSIGSTWVVDEATEGLRGKRLVPVLIEDVRQPFGFGQIHAADLTNWGGSVEHNEFQRLKDSISVKVQLRDQWAADFARQRDRERRKPGPHISQQTRDRSEGAGQGPDQRRREAMRRAWMAVPKENVAAATLVALLGGLAGPIALHASAKSAVLLWVLASLCAGFIIGRRNTEVPAMLRAAIAPGCGHAGGSLGMVFYQWAANQLTGSRPAAGIPLGQAGGVINLDNPLTQLVIVALAVATCFGSWLLISGAAASMKVASSALSQSYDVAPEGLERLGKWLIVLTGAGAAAVGVYSAFAR